MEDNYSSLTVLCIVGYMRKQSHEFHEVLKNTAEFKRRFASNKKLQAPSECLGDI